MRSLSSANAINSPLFYSGEEMTTMPVYFIAGPWRMNIDHHRLKPSAKAASG